MSSARNEFVDYVVELMADWAPVMARRMFGGYGLYREGSMFALIADDQLFFKADAGNEPQFERVGSHPFVYTSQIGRVGRFFCPRCITRVGTMRPCPPYLGAALRAQAAKAGKSGKGKRK
ncbi:MAG TPA: TfoX/Sxy family protein [Gallionella sp.]